MQDELRMTTYGDDAGALVVASPGHAAFAAALLTVGIMGLRTGDLTAIWSGVSRNAHGRDVLAYACAVVCLVAGAGMFVRRTALAAARLALFAFAAWLLFVRMPVVLRAPTTTGAWWGVGDTTVLLSASWILAATFAGQLHVASRGAAGRSRRLVSAMYGLSLIPFGIAHFTYLERTVSMVPAWLPWHLAWACLTGAAFILAGIALVVGIQPRLAATLSALEMGLFTVLVWVPIIVSGYTASDWMEFVSSCVLTTAAWVVADSFRGTPWLAMRPT